MWTRSASLALLAAGCAATPAVPPLPPLPPCEGPCRARADERLAALRGRWGTSTPSTYRLAMSFHEPGSGHTLSARGACAVRPPDALRLQLVGPAGSLALDLWVRGPDARLAIPAVERVERGPDAFGPGRPTAFLRWWLLAPLGGEVVDVQASADSSATRWVLRDSDGAQLTVLDQGDSLALERRAGDEVERIDARGGVCGEATYRSGRGVRAEIRCEGLGPPPRDRAFDDPDAPP